MIEQMIMAHSILVKIFLGFLVGGIAIPYMTSNNPLGFRKASFIYTMIFQALATMIAFTGVVAIFAGDLGWSFSTILMVIVWVALMFIEIKKYKLIKVGNVQKESTFQLLRGAFVKISILQTLLVVIMIVLKVLEAKGMISLG
ncbi:MAG: hypothetical protein DSZ10_02330 [Sulfurovum sp.]|nr:MAG: hypothetical protein DSZ10_02330 [Sulfurovum sp.]